MTKEKIIAVVAAVVLTIGGMILAVDLKAIVCGTPAAATK